jgi:hypothetical protein
MREPGGEHVLDELYYSAHLVAKFMPWVRTFYLVTQRPQRPIWWQASLGSMALVLVHHDEIWQDPSELPVFNSNAITREVVRIPGLAEHFILFDDDCFVGRPLDWSAFFGTNGAPTLRTRRLQAAHKDSGSNWRKQIENLMAAVQSVAGARVEVHSPVHVCSPHLKSQYTYVVQQLFGHVCSQFKRFRSDADLPTQYLVVACMHAQKKLAKLPGHIQTAFYTAGQLSKHSSPPPHLFCINDRLDSTDWETLELLLR